jgi:carboxymethylenebutenolidase
VKLKEGYVDLDTPSGVMRTFIFAPQEQGSFPGLVLFSEIYQVTGPIERTARQLAGRGYMVAVPEVFHEFEKPGTPLPYNEAGTDKGNDYKYRKELKAYDHDTRACLDYLQSLPQCNRRLGAVGICLGGHLSFRAAMDPDVQAAVCFYATDIHSSTLGAGKRDDSLGRMGDIRGEILMVWGRQDPHIPPQGRRIIYHALNESGVNYSWHEFNGEHAFMRDEESRGRYNPVLAELGYSIMFELFHRRLQLGISDQD